METDFDSKGLRRVMVILNYLKKLRIRGKIDVFQKLTSEAIFDSMWEAAVKICAKNEVSFQKIFGKLLLPKSSWTFFQEKK